MGTTPHPTKTDNVGEVQDNLYGALKEEVTFEANQMRGTGTAVDPNHSDVLVQKHVTGISVSLFVGIAIVLLAAIAGIVLYAHSHKASPGEHVGMLHRPFPERAHGRTTYGDGLVRANDIWVR